ncbi:MAG TPA: Hpt domain-containing protein, partial [Kineosporiaceae bacterium]|nr:Hpt domain-containing protein [Kineosporiaceae bacterium]
MEAIDEIVAEFLVESHENLDQLDRDLLALEQNPGSRELLASVFRTIHTIKGTSGFLAFHKLEKLTHVGENLLSRLRDGRIALTDERATQLLQMVDAVRGLLANIEASGTEGDTDHSALIQKLSALLEDGAAADAVAASTAAQTAAAQSAARADDEPAPAVAAAPAATAAPAASVPTAAPAATGTKRRAAKKSSATLTPDAAP